MSSELEKCSILFQSRDDCFAQFLPGGNTIHNDKTQLATLFPQATFIQLFSIIQQSIHNFAMIYYIRFLEFYYNCRYCIKSLKYIELFFKFGEAFFSLRHVHCIYYTFLSSCCLCVFRSFLLKSNEKYEYETNFHLIIAFFYLQ